MASVFKKGRDKNRRGAYWYVSYDDEQGRRRTRKGFTDKRATEQLATEIEQDIRRRKAGLIDPDEDFRRKARKMKLETLLKEYELGLGASTEKHGKLSMSRIRKLINGCEFKTLVDASAEKVRKQLDLMKKEKKFGNKTYNHYLQAIDAFGNWLVATKRCLSNPFGGIPRLNTAVDVRRQRRALTPQETIKLVSSARASQKKIQTYDGETRARIYVFSFMTGLRRKELGSLTPESFDFSSDPATITVEAACSKHRKKDVLPLHPELATSCYEWISSLQPEEFLFPGLEKKKTSVMVKKDLESVGIPYRTREGVADFHAAGRHTHITELLRCGVTLAEARELARHSDIRMTMRYTHIGLEDQAKAVEKLQYGEDLAGSFGGVAGNSATKNDESWQRYGSGTPRARGQSKAIADNSRQSSEASDQKKNPGKNRGFSLASREESLVDKLNQWMEAAGIEPASREVSNLASTCVVVDLNFA